MTLGLRAKLTFAIAALMVALAAFFILYLPTRQAETAGEALRSRARSISLALAVAMGPSVGEDAADTAERLRHFATHAETDSDIAYIVIRRPDGSVLASYLSPSLPRDVAEVVVREAAAAPDPGDAYTDESVPVVQQRAGGPVVAGALTTGLSRHSAAEVRASGRTSALLIGAFIVILGVGVAWLVGGTLTTPVLDAVKKLHEVSSSLAAAARDQEASSAEEAAAVAQTRRSMETLLDSAQQIADRSSEVLGNAERSTNGSKHIADRIGNLNELSEKVTDILATIMQVADKADLLALNASLEGTRAGEAGKGFALVAAEMRRLAENVMESVSGIRELMKDMREASQAAVAASEEGTRSSTATTHSAREIALLTQEQRQATEQVMASMDEMGEILNITLDGIQRTTLSANQLTELAATLSRIVNPSQSGKAGGSEERDMDPA